MNVRLLLGVCLLARAGAGPLAFPVRNLPAGISSYRTAEQGPQGWVFGASNGVVLPGSSWRAWTGAYGSDMIGACPLRGGAVVICGYGYCSLLLAGHERVLLAQGSFDSSATDGATALVASSTMVYAVDERGIIASLPIQAVAHKARVFCLEGRLLTLAPDFGIFEFVHGGFRRVDHQAWAEGNFVSSIDSAHGQSVAVSRNGFFRATGGGPFQPVLPELWKELRGRLVDGALAAGNDLVVASYVDGVAAYSPAGRRTWSLPPDTFGGSVYFLRSLEDGFMVGSSAGIYIVPDPARYDFRPLPVGDINSLTRTPDGSLFRVGDRLYSTTRGALRTDPAVFTALPFPGGEITAGLAFVALPDGRKLQLPDREVPQLAVLGDRCAVVHGRHVSLYRDQALQEIRTRAEVDSVAAVDGGFILGTDQGVVALDRDGLVGDSFGEGRTRVISVTDTEAVAYDGARHLFDAEGRLLGELPFSDLISAVRWQGDLVLLGRLPSGATCVLRRGSPGPLTALDLPVESPVGLALDADRLCVIAVGFLLEVRDPVPLDFPRELPAVRTSKGATGLRLDKDEDNVTLLIPPRRLGPWPSPGYQYQVANGPWEDVLPGSTVPVSRLRPGSTRITVRSSLGIGTRQVDFVAVRPFPWWQRWPAWCLYLATAGLLVWGFVKWRLRSVVQEQQRLQTLVDLRTAELKKAQAIREEFFSTLSHEIRNPLNGVVGLCDILAAAPPGAIGLKEKRLVQTLKGCASQLRSMLDDVLDFSRIDRAEIQLNLESFDLVGAVEGAVRSVDPALAHSELILPTDPIWVTGDGGKFRQVVVNLASNGIKYGIPPRIRVTLGTRCAADGRLAAALSVSNTGHTIPPDEIERMFHGFVRGSDAIRRGISGHGIGLAVSRRIAQAMEGALVAQSHEGLTILTFEVVLAAADAPIAVEETRRPPKISRALAIEDESYNRVVLGHILEQLDYSVDWAADGRSALERIREGSYDLILTDYQLPDTNGAELTRKILEVTPAPKPPVLAITAYSSQEKTSELLQAGVAAIVSKPISVEKLSAAIQGLARSAVRRRSEPDAPAPTFNLQPLQASGGARLVAQFAGDLEASWNALLAEFAAATPDARHVHAFCSKILVAEALEAARLVSLLERAVRRGHDAEAAQLLRTLRPLVEALLAAARSASYK